jgi:hypothetical protein
MPYLQQGWDTARAIFNNPGLNPQGYNAQLLAGAGPDVLNAANQAAKQFNYATNGGYAGYNSPAFGGYTNVAGGGTPGQQQADYATGQLQGLAGQSAQTGQSYADLMRNTAAGTMGAIANPLNYMNQQASGYYLNSNPYLDKMYGSAADAVSRQYQTTTAPRTASSYEGAGRYGSPSAQNAVSQNEQNLGSTLNNLASNIYGTNYANERSLQNTATANLGQLGLNANQQMLSGYGAAGNQALAGFGQAGSEYGAAGNLGLSGTQQQLAGLGGLAQGYQAGNTTALNAAAMAPQIQAGYTYGPQQQIAAYNGLQALQWDPVSQYMRLINTPNPFPSTTSQQPIYGSGIGQTLGGIGSLVSGIGSIAGLFSDRRLKEDTHVVGNVGRLPVHLFRYKGDPTPRIGFMADEVERVDPGAVVMTNLGFKAVNYGRAAASALQE